MSITLIKNSNNAARSHSFRSPCDLYFAFFLRLYETQRNSYSIFLFLYLSIFSSIAYTMIRFILHCSLLLFISFAFILTNEITIIYHPTPSFLRQLPALSQPVLCYRRIWLKNRFYRCYENALMRSGIKSSTVGCASWQFDSKKIGWSFDK